MANIISTVITASTKGFAAACEKAKSLARGLGGALKSIFSRFTFTADSIVNLVKHAFQAATAFENAATRLAPLVGGLKEARGLAEKLRDAAANGTMSFDELVGVASRLSAVFGNSKDVEAWTDVFHNLAAGTGKDINELIANFVKVKASGRMEGGFLDMFAQKGINIFEPLIAQTGKTETELRKMAATGGLTFAHIEAASLTQSGVVKIAENLQDPLTSAVPNASQVQTGFDLLHNTISALTARVAALEAALNP